MEHWEHEELLSMIIANNNEEEAERLINEEDMDVQCDDKFGVGFEEFSAIVRAIMPYTPMLKSPLTKSVHHCLGVTMGGGGFRAIVKREPKNGV